jgi:hypothetical protein
MIMSKKYGLAIANESSERAEPGMVCGDKSL